MSPFASALIAYAGGVCAIALFCAIAFCDQPSTLDEEWARRLARRSRRFAFVGVAHPVIALSAVALAHDAKQGSARPDEPPGVQTAQTPAAGSLIASLIVMITVIAQRAN